MAVSSAVQAAKDGAFLDVTLSPNSPEAAFPDAYDEWRQRVKVRVTSPPEDNRANDELVDLAADFFDAEVSIVRGRRQPRKRLWVGLAADRVVQRLTDAGL